MKTIHRMNSERYVGDSKLHEMVAIAMEEDWDVCVAHMECDHARPRRRDRARAPPPANSRRRTCRLASLCACTGMMRFFHPQMIAQCANKPGPTIDQMIDFVLASLSPRGKAN